MLKGSLAFGQSVRLSCKKVSRFRLNEIMCPVYISFLLASRITFYSNRSSSCLQKMFDKDRLFAFYFGL